MRSQLVIYIRGQNGIERPLLLIIYIYIYIYIKWVFVRTQP